MFFKKLFIGSSIIIGTPLISAFGFTYYLFPELRDNKYEIY
jgi:hypothetical protein